MALRLRVTLGYILVAISLSSYASSGLESSIGPIVGDDVRFTSSEYPVPSPPTLFRRGTTYITWKFVSPVNSSADYNYRIVDAKYNRLGECDMRSHTCETKNLRPGTAITAHMTACKQVHGGYICSNKSTPSVFSTLTNPPSRVRVWPSGPNSVVATIDPPKDTTGIEYYTVRAREGHNGGCSVEAGPNPECEITGLHPARSYTLEVRSWMGGEFNQTCSDPITIVGWTLPQYPKSVTVRPGSSSSLVVGVSLPGGDIGPDYYEVVLRGGRPLTSCTIWPNVSLECKLEGLDAATEHHVSVRGCLSVSEPALCGRRFNASGWTKPKEPTGVSLEPITSSSVILRLSKPEVVNHVIQYTATLRGGFTTKHCSVMAQEKPECQFEGLKAATEYSVTVSACIDLKHMVLCSNNVTASVWTKPNSPLEMLVERVTSNSFFVSWLEPEGVTDGVGFYRAVAMTASEIATETARHFCSANASQGDLGCSIEGLSPATIYTVSVKFCVSKSLCSEEAGPTNVQTSTVFEEYRLMIIVGATALVFGTIILPVLLCLRKKQKKEERRACQSGKDGVDEPEAMKDEA